MHIHESYGSAAVKVFLATIGLLVFFFLSAPLMAWADSAADCSGFKITQCLYIPPNDQFPHMYHLTFGHDSGRRVFRVKDRIWSPAQGLGFSFQNQRGLDQSFCSGFKINKCQYLPPNDQFPHMWHLSIGHDSGRPVFRMKDRVWSPAIGLGFTLQ